LISKKKKILFFGELPPISIHGASISNEINLRMLEDSFFITKVIEIYSIKNHSSGYITKVFFFVRSYLKFIQKSFTKKYGFFYGVVYLSTFGILKNIFVVFIFKITNPKGEIILHFHRSDFKDFLKKKINKCFYTILDFFVDKFILLSESQKNDFNSKNNKYFVLKNTIQNEYYFSKTEQKYAKSYGYLKLIYLGNYIREKGIIELIKAVIKVNKEYVKFELNLFGDFASENLKKEVLSLIDRLDFIRINGPINDENKFLKLYESDLLLLPSYNEGLPLVLLESMSIGLPVIISNIGYIQDALGEDYPLYCEAKSVNSIVQNLNKYYDLGDKLELNFYMLEKYKKYSHESHYNELIKIFSFEN
jgi:glycosyltransferase involved in cell wall biosynthesis